MIGLPKKLRPFSTPSRILWQLLFLLALLAIVGCDSEAEAEPTPFAMPSPTVTVVVNQPLPLPITELAASPAFFEGSTLQLTGQFKKLPKLICAGEKHTSPASWGLVAGGLLAQAGGFDAPLRTLVPDDLTVTVEGRWLRWQGPVGCGKKAMQQDLWYLEVTEILSPSPLTLVTLTPSSDEGEPEAVAQAESTPPPTESEEEETGSDEDDFADEPPEEEEEEPFPSDEETADATPTSPSVPASTPTPVDDGDLVPTPTAQSQAATATPRATATDVPTATAVSTTDPDVPINTPTATPAANEPTAAPTATPATSQTTESQGDIDTEEFKFGALDGSTIHEWIFDAIDTTPLNISVAALDADVTINLFDPSGNGIATASSATEYQAGVIADQALNETGEYKIQVRAAANQTTDYVLLITSDETEDIDLAGVLDDGDEGAGTIIENSTDYWIFWGAAGDTVTITVVPTDDAIPYISLYDRDSSFLEDSDEDSGADGWTVSHTLMTSSLYLIEIEEYDFSAMNYEIELLFE
ncbi:MAG: hypothetical protein AAF614_23680 [Chloroflexota bacterium]